MADRDPDDTAPTPLQEAPAPLRASTTDVAEFLEIVNQVAIVWAEIYPQGSATPREFAGHFNKTYEALRNVPSNLRGRVIFLPELGLPPPMQPIALLIRDMRRWRSNKKPGLTTLKSPKMATYLEALSLIAKLSPELHTSFEAELALAPASYFASERDWLRRMTALAQKIAETGVYAQHMARFCSDEAKLGWRDKRRAWHAWAREMGRMIAEQLVADADQRGHPAPSTALTNAQSIATRLAVRLLALGGSNVSCDAFAAVHRTVAKSQGRSRGRVFPEKTAKNCNR